MKRITTLVCAFSISFGAAATMAYATQRGNQRNQASQGNGPRFEQDRRGPNQGRQRDRDLDSREADKTQAERVRELREDTADRFEERLQRNPELRAKLERLLPPGTNVTTAASGFKNQGQFIAALHTSKNLGIPFDQLKSKMTGTDPMSLGQAIRELKPAMTERESLREAERAEDQARVTGR
jgi:hypothetical protein